MEWLLPFTFLVGGLLFLFLAGLPVFIAFLIIDIVGIIIFMGGIAGLSSLVRSMIDSIGVFTLVPVPLFILMGAITFSSGIASNAISVTEKILYRLPGRLSMVANGTGALFGCLTGSALGTCAMFSSIFVPEMRQRNYSKYMIAGPIMASSTLSVIIPPSTLVVVLAAQAGISVGHLLIAGILPGFLLFFLYGAYITISCSIKPSWAPLAEEIASLDKHIIIQIIKYILPLSLIVFSVIGSIFLGIATPTESSALGATACFLLAAIYRSLTFKAVSTAIFSCLHTSTMIFMIVAGSVAFSQLLSFTGITQGIVELTTNLPLPPLLIATTIVLILILMGTMIEQISMIMIGVPLFMPIIVELGYDPIWFGIIMLLSITLGLITPPFGLLLFIMKGFVPPEIKMSDIYQSALPFILLTFIGILAILLFPDIAIWLPQNM